MTDQHTNTATELLPTEEEVRQALKSVYDPEIGISVLDLGLVYGVQIDRDSKNVIIDMTLTTPACPLGPVIKTQAHAVLVNRASRPSTTSTSTWSGRRGGTRASWLQKRPRLSSGSGKDFSD